MKEGNGDGGNKTDSNDDESGTKRGGSGAVSLPEMPHLL